MRVKRRFKRRVMEIYEETKNVVKMGENKSEEFWTEYGVRQGCPLSPTLFNAYIADLEEEMRRGQEGGMIEREDWKREGAESNIRR